MTISDLFDELEEQMRQLNPQMHRVYKSCLKQSASKSDDVDVIPLSEQSQILKKSHKEVDTGEFQIKLDYQGDKVIRRVSGRTSRNTISSGSMYSSIRGYCSGILYHGRYASRPVHENCCFSTR